MNILMKIIGSVDHADKQPLFDRILTHMYRSLHETRPTGIEVYFPSLRRFIVKDDNNPRFVHEFLQVRNFLEWSLRQGQFNKKKKTTIF